MGENEDIILLSLYEKGLITLTDISERLGIEKCNKLFEKLNMSITTYECNDNYKIAEVGNEKYEVIYNKALKSGCCGSYDKEYNIDGTIFRIGFNYGH